MGRGKIYPQLLLGTHTHSVSMSRGLPRVRLATTENPIIPRLVPPSPLVLLFMVGTWELLYQGPQYPWKCHTAILSDTFREHVACHPFFFPVSVLSFPWALLTHKVSALTTPSSGPSASSLQWAQLPLLSALQKTSEAKKYRLAIGMWRWDRENIGRKPNCLNKLFCPMQYCMAISVILYSQAN